MAPAPMDLEPVTDWLWCLRTPLVQAYAVRQGDGFHLIDTSTAGQHDAILDGLASLTASGDVEIGDILLTHGHDDHTGSAAALAERTGARVLGPRADAPVIEGARTAPPPDLRDWEVPLYEQTLPLVPPAPPVELDVAVEDGATLEWDPPARVLAAPGHTPGSIAVLFEAEGVLVAGDAIASHDGTPMVGVFNADVPEAISTFRRLALLDADIACFGHGAPLVGGAAERLRQVAGSLS
jgi:glyoxylase-like metal-dependent hydrolase (beta-lactamase superfamily II)